MDLEKVFRHGSYKALIRATVTRPALRHMAMKFIEKKVYKGDVEENEEGRPTQVQQDKVDYLSALMNCADRSLRRGLISKHVANRLIEVFVDNVVCNQEALREYKDPRSYPPMFVTVSPGKRCNLKCTGCYACSDSRTSAKLDFNTFDRILTEKEKLWNSFFTVISGGEPFLWEDEGHDLVDMAARHSSNFFLVYTNGTLIDKKMAKRLEEVGNMTLAISVEGFEAETDARRGKGVHRRILKAFENLREVGVPFGISVTATKHNWDVVTSDKFVDYYFDEQGITYEWLFQYMPIGRKHTLDLMVTPEQRLEMLKRTYRFVRERKVLVADFWNSGVVSNGCISAGRSGGYFYIDWDGDVTPCVFIPYAAANIYDIYENGGDLNTILKTPLFRHIREWQDEYGYAQPAERTGNWLCPCAIRDHYDRFYEEAATCDIKPIDSEAAEALKDKGYYNGMVKYGRDFDRLTSAKWKKEYLSTCEKPRAHKAVKSA